MLTAAPVSRSALVRILRAPGMLGAEGVDHVGGEPAPGVGRVVAGRGHDAGVGEQQHGHIRRDEIRAEGALVLCSSYELFQVFQGALS